MGDPVSLMVDGVSDLRDVTATGKTRILVLLPFDRVVVERPSGLRGTVYCGRSGSLVNAVLLENRLGVRITGQSLALPSIKHE